MEAAIPGLRRMANGDATQPRAQHWCNGCCLGPDGLFSRATAVDNFYAAITAVGIFGGLGNARAAKN
eukprot:10972071-Prorocentrum_lima.AAC.1